MGNNEQQWATISNTGQQWTRMYNSPEREGPSMGCPPPPPASKAAAPVAPSTPEVLKNTEGSSLDTLTISPTIEKREELEEEDPSSPGLTEVVSPPASVPEAVSLPPPHLSPATSTSAAPAPSSDGRKVEEWKCILNCDETFSTRKELSKHLTSCFSDKVTQWVF